MRFARQAAPILFLVLAFALPIAASASLLPSEIIPAACHCDGTNEQPMSAPDFGCVFQTIQNVMNFAVMISFLFLTFAIAYAGFMWMINSVNPEGKEQARALLTNTLIGILIVISAWILVDFVMKKIYDNGAFGPWNEILYANSGTQCIKINPSTGIPAGTNSGGLGVAQSGTDKRTAAQKAQAEQSVRVQLAAAGVLVNHPENKSGCGVNVNGVSAGCTDVSGLKSATASFTMSLASAFCKKAASANGCNVTITGGSELGHSSGHTNGTKVDIRDDAALNTYITSHLTSAGTRGGDHGGPGYTDSCGNVYVHETAYSHWDIEVKSNCSLPINN